MSAFAKNLSIRRMNELVGVLVLLAFAGLFLLVRSGLNEIEQTYYQSAQAGQTQAALQRLLGAGLLHNSARGVRFANPGDERALQTMTEALAKATAEADLLHQHAPTLFASVQPNWATFARTAATVESAARQGPMPQELMREMLASWRGLKFPLEERLAEVDTKIAAITQNFETQMAQIKSRIITAVPIAAAIIMALVLFTCARAIAAFGKMEQMMKDIAEGEGDLTRRLDEQGAHEIARMGAAFNLFVAKVQAMVRQVSRTVEQLSASAEGMSSITEKINRELHQQQSEADQVATAMNQMTATVQEVASHASKAAEAARDATGQANDGKEKTEQTVSAMGTLAAQIEEAAGVIKSLEKESVAIGGVLDVIRGIAEQTNLLALNAAIEAARAGDQGRGFSVVADEVRSLASRTQASTQEVQTMIERLQAGADNAVGAMGTGQAQAKAGVEKASQAGVALETINRSVGTISDMNIQIASAAEEQSCVAEEINRNLVKITQSLDAIAQGTQDTAAAGEQLAALASDLQQMVGQFKV